MRKYIEAATINLVVFLPLFCNANQDVQARLESSLKAAQSIPVAEIHWTDVLSIEDPAMLKMLKVDKNGFSRTTEYAYLVSGQKFLATSSLASGTETNLVHSLKSSFDGKTYYTYSDAPNYLTKNGSLKSTADASEDGYNPLVQPFLFLKACYDSNSIAPLRFSDITSTQFATNIVLPAAQKVGNQIILSLSGHMRSEGASTWTIAMDEAGDYFTPETITESVPNKKIVFICKYANYTNILTYPFPARIEWSMNQYPLTKPPVVLSTGLITLVSARVPDQISDSMFRLDNEEQKAAVVWDWNSQKLTKSAPQLAKIQTEHKTVRIIVLSLLFVTMIVLPVGVLLARKSEANKK